MRIQDFGISMDTLFAFDSPVKVSLLAGGKGLGRIITSVIRLETDKRIPALSEGVLFLAECLPAADEQWLQKALWEINAAGAAGLGAKQVGSLPSSVVETADELGLPLFSIPGEAPLMEVANQVLTRVLDSQSQVLEKIQEINRALTSTMLHGGNLQEICRILYQRFGNSVAISSDFLSSYVLNTTPEKRPVIREFLETEKRKVYNGGRDENREVTRQPGHLAGVECNRIMVPIFSDNMLHGRLYIWEDFRPISGVEQSVLESATSLIALDMMKKMSVLHMENSNRGGFLADLLSGEPRQQQKALSNAKYFDFDTKAGHQVMVIRLRRRTGAGKDTLYQFNTYIIRMLQQTVRNTVVKIVYANQGNQIMLLLESTPSGGENLARPIDDFIEALYQRFSQEGISGLLVMGVGREYHDVSELHKSLLEAKRALGCPAVKQDGTIWFQRMGAYRLLCHEAIRDEAELFCEEMLSPILNYDRDKDAHLLETLNQYFAQQGNLTKISDRMNVHYNTVSNRLQKIQQLAGLQLDDEQVALNLQIALRIYAAYRDDKPDRGG